MKRSYGPPPPEFRRGRLFENLNPIFIKTIKNVYEQEKIM